MSDYSPSRKCVLTDGLVVFAHIPPPHHGQSKMVETDLAILREEYGENIHHVDARWSASTDDIGSSSWRKAFLIFIYVREALSICWKKGARGLYYVPGPVKWSAVIRDFLVLLLLRSFFRKIVFHWHAIGQGEWAYGSDRVKLAGPLWLGRGMSFFSRWALSEPDLSLVVSSSSARDAVAVNSGKIEVVWNGIPDMAGAEPKERSAPIKKLLFFSRGSAEKGLLDALNAVEICAREQNWSTGEYSLTIAGGVDLDIESEVASLCSKCEQAGVRIERRDFVVGLEKAELFQDHDLLLFPSHWESFGLVIVEAMIFDLPVVAAASDGALGVLGDDYPFLSEPGNTVDFANAMIRSLRALPSHHSKFSGRKVYLEKFCIRRHREVLLRAVSER